MTEDNARFVKESGPIADGTVEIDKKSARQIHKSDSTNNKTMKKGKRTAKKKSRTTVSQAKNITKDEVAKTDIESRDLEE
jgi:hypothetical protein